MTIGLKQAFRGGVVIAIVAVSCLAAASANADRWKNNFNRGGGGGSGGGHYSYHGYYYPHYDYGFWGPAFGFGMGAFFGYALAQPYYYYVPRYYIPRYAPAYGSRDAYCRARYRSYNPNTGTYTGYDGRQHRCAWIGSRSAPAAGYVPSGRPSGGGAPVIRFGCAEAIAQHGENSAEARTHC